LAKTEGVAPFLHTAIQQMGISLPETDRETLEQIHYQTVAADTYRLQDLERILATLSTVPLPVLLLKGPALTETLYRDLALRAMGDIDLVVPTLHVPISQQILTELGYAPTEIDVSPGAHLDYRNEQAFEYREPHHATVELHWHLLDIPYYLHKVPMNWFWQNTETVEIAGHPVQVLNPEANMLYLPAHLALHHRFHGLRWFVDLALLVHKHHDSLDWEVVLAAAQEFELLLVLRETLDRLASYWPSLPLDEPRRRLHRLQPAPFERRLFRLLTVEPRSPLLDFYTDVVCLPSPSERVRFILLNLFPQRAYMAKRYGLKRAWQLPYGYLYRLGDGLLKLTRTLCLGKTPHQPITATKGQTYLSKSQKIERQQLQPPLCSQRPPQQDRVPFNIMVDQNRSHDMPNLAFSACSLAQISSCPGFGGIAAISANRSRLRSSQYWRDS
jgi:hypothetical protein